MASSSYGQGEHTAAIPLEAAYALASLNFRGFFRDNCDLPRVHHYAGALFRFLFRLAAPFATAAPLRQCWRAPSGPAGI
jgi:hypothetical protein